MIIIKKKKKIILKKEQKQPTPIAPSCTVSILPKKQHASWPVEPPESETALKFITACHDKEILRGWRAARDLIQINHERYSGKRYAMKGGDERETLMRKARVVYWLQRCEFERTGRELSQAFWDNYDAAFADRLDKLDPVFIDAFSLMREEKEMGTKFVVKKKNADQAEVVPEKTAKTKPSVIAKKSPEVKKNLVTTVPQKKQKAGSTKGKQSSGDLVFGKYSPASVGRWGGAHGFTGGQVIGGIESLGSSITKACAQTMVMLGRNGKGSLPEMNKNEQAQVKKAMEAIPSRKKSKD